MPWRSSAEQKKYNIMSCSCSRTIFTTTSPFVFCKSAYCLEYIFLFSISNAHISAKISEVEWKNNSVFSPNERHYHEQTELVFDNVCSTSWFIMVNCTSSNAYRRRWHTKKYRKYSTNNNNINNLYLHFHFVADCRRFRKSLQRRRHRNRNETIISVRSDWRCSKFTPSGCSNYCRPFLRSGR